MSEVKCRCFDILEVIVGAQILVSERVCVVEHGPLHSWILDINKDNEIRIYHEHVKVANISLTFILNLPSPRLIATWSGDAHATARVTTSSQFGEFFNSSAKSTVNAPGGSAPELLAMPRLRISWILFTQRPEKILLSVTMFAATEQR